MRAPTGQTRSNPLSRRSQLEKSFNKTRIHAELYEITRARVTRLPRVTCEVSEITGRNRVHENFVRKFRPVSARKAILLPINVPYLEENRGRVWEQSTPSVSLGPGIGVFGS